MPEMQAKWFISQFRFSSFSGVAGGFKWNNVFLVPKLGGVISGFYDINFIFFSTGFNPVFDETFEFHINLPDLALVRFVAQDDDFIGDGFIGQYTIPLNCIQPGENKAAIKGQNMTFVFKIMEKNTVWSYSGREYGP